MLALSVRVGQAVSIGETAAIKVKEKSGRMVKLIFFTKEPVELIPDGLIPARFTHGITGERRRVLEVIPLAQ